MDTTCPLTCHTAESQFPEKAAELRRFTHPPYTINNGDATGKVRLPLGTNTVSPLAQHLGGKVLHYDVHNAYSLATIQATWRALADLFPHRRPFILTR